MNNNQIFTPQHIVKKMLDLIGYHGDNIRHKSIFEPSFGDGAFLQEIVLRILDYAKQNGLSKEDTISMLDHIHGVEIDRQCYQLAIQKLNNILEPYSIKYQWHNLACCDTLMYNPPMKFDLCVGNPPYTKIQHMDIYTREHIVQHYQFGKGITDLYVVFIEYCLKVTAGKVCLITPNSYFQNKSQAALREYLADNNLVKRIIEYGTVKVFKNASTYTAITLFDKHHISDVSSDILHHNSDVEYTSMQDEHTPAYTTSINLKKFRAKPWIFSSQSDEVFLDSITQRPIKFGDLCNVAFGLATNADKVYIIDKSDACLFEPDILKPITKASTLNDESMVLFPYEWNATTQRYEIIPENVMQSRYPKAYQYLCNNKDILDKRDMDPGGVWYQYARSQAIQSCVLPKIAIKRTIHPDNTQCEIKELCPNTLVYSGIYITLKNTAHYQLVKQVLLSEDFYRYLLLVGHDISGGYKMFIPRHVKEYRIDVKSFQK